MSPNPVHVGQGLVIDFVDRSCCTLPPSMQTNDVALALSIWLLHWNEGSKEELPDEFVATGS